MLLGARKGWIMSTAHFAKEALLGGGTGSGGAAASPVCRWLGLAAAPTFAVMALWTALFSAQPDMLCLAMRGSSAMSGMTLMYLLMSVFHSSPWLKLIASRRTGERAQLMSAAMTFSSSGRNDAALRSGLRTTRKARPSNRHCSSIARPLAAAAESRVPSARAAR